MQCVCFVLLILHWALLLVSRVTTVLYIRHFDKLLASVPSVTLLYTFILHDLSRIQVLIVWVITLNAFSLNSYNSRFLRTFWLSYIYYWTPENSGTDFLTYNTGFLRTVALAFLHMILDSWEQWHCPSYIWYWIPENSGTVLLTYDTGFLRTLVLAFLHIILDYWEKWHWLSYI